MTSISSAPDNGRHARCDSLRSWPAVCRASAGILLLLTLGLAGCSSDDDDRAARIQIKIEPSAVMGGAPLTVRAELCACLESALQIAIDGGAPVTLACGESRALQVAAGRHTLSVYAPQLGSPLSAAFMLESGRALQVVLACR